MGTSQKFNFGRWLISRMGLTFLIFLAIATFFLITEHRAHLFGILPYILLLLSLIVFLFLGRGQNGSNVHADRQTKERK